MQKYVKQLSRKLNKTNIIKIIIAASVILIGSVFLVICFNRLNEDEKMLYDACLSMKKMLKAPESFRLYDEAFLLKHYDEKNDIDDTILVFKYGAVNGFNVSITEEAIFADGEFVGNYSDSSGNNVKLATAKYTIMNIINNGERSNNEKGWEKVDLDYEVVRDKVE